MNSVKIVCLDDTNRPPQIPQPEWVKKDEWYTLTFVAFCKPQNISGGSLYEKPLGPHCHPFEYFRLSRFGVLASDLPALEALINACTDLDGLDLSELFKTHKEEMPQLIETD